MKMHLETSERNLIADYGPGKISVAGEVYTSTVTVGPSTIVAGPDLPSIDRLELDDFADVLALEPEIILLGTGSKHRFPHPRLAAELSTKGTALEVMNTSAACRTYNVLISEYREVVAVLLPID